MNFNFETLVGGRTKARNGFCWGRWKTNHKNVKKKTFFFENCKNQKWSIPFNLIVTGPLGQGNRFSCLVPGSKEAYFARENLMPVARFPTFTAESAPRGHALHELTISHNSSWEQSSITIIRHRRERDNASFHQNGSQNEPGFRPASLQAFPSPLPGLSPVWKWPQSSKLDQSWGLSGNGRDLNCRDRGHLQQHRGARKELCAKEALESAVRGRE